MKKAILCALVILMGMASVQGLATSVPSKTTQDLAAVVSFALDNGAALPEGFIIRLLEETESADKVLKQLADFVAGQELAPARFFSEAVQNALTLLLPEGMDLDQFVIDEFAPMSVEGYQESYGDVTVSLRFATEYAEGQEMAALVGVVTGTDDQGNPVIDWTPVQAEPEEGLVTVHFPQSLLTKLNGQDAMIAILSKDPAK